jgi:hypothetical protein
MPNRIDSRRTVCATRVSASTAGVLCGISGLEHGFFETLQGSTAPATLLISAIGPANRFWPGGTETALTIVPNYLVTGILAMVVSIMVIIWSAAFIQRKHGALIFLTLSVMQFLVGGGFAQIFLVIVTAAAATQINASLNWFRAIVPVSVRRFLAKLWVWLLVAFVLVFSSAIFAAIFGYIPIVSTLFSLRGSDLTGLLYALGYVMLVLLPLTFLAGFAYDSLTA